MQKDFHYCCIKALAYKAGFPEEEAETVAYASQFTDDAVRHRPIRVSGVPGMPGLRLKNGWLDPICTSHSMLDLIISSRKERSQREVYIPFHFVPGKAYKGRGRYDYVARQNSQFARKLVQLAVTWLKHNVGERTLGLIKLGISLHTFADTWSHNLFSGRDSVAENDIEELDIPDDHRIDLDDYVKGIAHRVPVFVGHGQAAYFPDMAHLSWGYLPVGSSTMVIRDNTQDFVRAAEAIYTTLCRISPNASKLTEWGDICRSIEACLAFPDKDLEAKESNWRQAFPDTAFRYKKDGWWKAGFKKKSVPSSGKARKPTYVFRGDTRFLLFHVAAKEQRDFVIGNIRPDLG